MRMLELHVDIRLISGRNDGRFYQWFDMDTSCLLFYCGKYDVYAHIVFFLYIS